MNTLQITEALKHVDKVVAPHFVGVFPCDMLKSLNMSKLTYPCALVANTDRKGEPGEHWVAFFIDQDGDRVEYFDSFGLPPINCDLFEFFQQFEKCQFNDVQLQATNSTVCGHYCIAFIARRMRGQSLRDIVTKFFITSPVGASDSLIGELVNVVYDIDGRVNGEKRDIEESDVGLVGSGERDEIVVQCCCALSECHRLCSCMQEFCGVGSGCS